MRRLLAIIAAVSVMSAMPALAGGPYTLDAKGNCHEAGGKFAKKALCAPPTRCRDKKSGRFAKCGAPGAIPA